MHSKSAIRYLFLLIIFLTGLIVPQLTQTSVLAVDDFIKNANNQPIIYLFYSNNCNHCKQEIEFLQSITKNQLKAKVAMFEISNNQQHQQLFLDIMKQLDQPVTGVPALVIGQEVIVGYDNKSTNTQTAIRTKIQKFSKKPDQNINQSILSQADKTDPLLMEGGEIKNQKPQPENYNQIPETTTRATKDKSVAIAIATICAVAIIGLVVFRIKNHTSRNQGAEK